jgi:hypothetical protein
LHCKSMQFIQGSNRSQTYFATLEGQVSTDNPVRLIDAFIDKLDLQKLGFIKKTDPLNMRMTSNSQTSLLLPK